MRPLTEAEVLLTHNVLYRNDYLGLLGVERIDGVTGCFEIFEEGGRTWYTNFEENGEEE